MGFNVTGQEVATGVHDPAVMFAVAAAIIIIGVIVYGMYYMVTSLK